MRIQPIVEGYGEVEAVPELLRRMIREAGLHEIGVGTPIRISRPSFASEDAFKRAVGVAALQQDCRSILVLLDADDDCPVDLAPRLLDWARAQAGHMPIGIVVAMREYEAWFLSAMESLRGLRGVASDARAFPDAEAVRDAKGRLADLMKDGYSERLDQPAFSSRFDFGSAYRRCRSFRKMAKVFGELTRSMGSAGSAWPPQTWAEGA